jgi:hypothetical protein
MAQDARLDNLPLPDRERTGFRITDCAIHFTGLRAECQSASDTSAIPITANSIKAARSDW